MNIMPADMCFFYYVADRSPAVTLWGSSEGHGLADLLLSQGIRHIVCSPGGSVSRDMLYRQARCCTASPEQVEDAVDTALSEHEVVLFVSDDLRAVARLSQKRGCLAFHLSAAGKPGLDNNAFIDINSLSFLAPYAAATRPRNLLQLVQRMPVDHRAMIRDRNRVIADQTARRGGVHILGTGSNGKMLHDECRNAGIAVLGFIDNDPSKQGTQFLTLDVGSPASLSPEEDVVLIANGKHTHDITARLRQSGFRYLQNIAEFFSAINRTSELGLFFHDDLLANKVRYHALYLLMADETSRTVLDDMIGFHQTFDANFAGHACDRTTPQWFDRLCFSPRTDHVYVDGGGYDGDTALSFIRQNGGRYRSIHVIEPDPAIAERARENLRSYENIQIHNVGLSNKEEILYFSQTGLTDGRLSHSHGIRVRVNALDTIVKEQMTYLKLDIEGAEAAALDGAARHIRDGAPSLAIAVYHKPGDYWSIPKAIHKISPSYRFYLRHYTQFAYETVLYAAPKSRTN